MSDADLEGLDEPVQRYLAFAGVAGRAIDRSLLVRMQGRFRLKPDGPWMPMVAWQCNLAQPVSRVFAMVIRFGGAIPMIGSDTYLSGTGRMVGKLGGLVTVADGAGPEFDVGELSTWVNDAVLLAPSMLLGVGATFRGLDDHRFEVRVRDQDHEVAAQVAVDDRGAPVDYVTTDRWAALPDGLVRAPWRTPISGWTRSPAGRPVPLPGGATWDLPDGPFTYVEAGFDPATLRHDVAPAEAGT